MSAPTFDPSLTLREWWAMLDDAGVRRAEPIGPPGGIGPELAAPTLQTHGTPEQQARFLPPIRRGTEAWCQLFSEPGAGSDLASLTTRAVPTDGGWLVTGQKVWNSGASTADLGLLLARTDPSAPKHEGISYFAIDMRQPGVETRPLRQMNGRAEFDEVFLTDAFVGGDRLVGARNDGWSVAKTTLAFERRSIGSRGARHAFPGGEANGFLDRTLGELLDLPKASAPAYMLSTRRMLELAREHGRTGDPVVRQRLAAYRAMTSARPQGVPSAGKLAVSNIARASRDLSLSILGAEGMLAGPEVDVALSSFAAGTGGGTDQIQRNVLAERVLGLPKEPS